MATLDTNSGAEMDETIVSLDEDITEDPGANTDEGLALDKFRSPWARAFGYAGGAAAIGGAAVGIGVLAADHQTLSADQVAELQGTSDPLGSPIKVSGKDEETSTDEMTGPDPDPENMTNAERARDLTERLKERCPEGPEAFLQEECPELLALAMENGFFQQGGNPWEEITQGMEDTFNDIGDGVEQTYNDAKEGLANNMWKFMAVFVLLLAFAAASTTLGLLALKGIGKGLVYGYKALKGKDKGVLVNQEDIGSLAASIAPALPGAFGQGTNADTRLALGTTALEALGDDQGEFEEYAEILEDMLRDIRFSSSKRGAELYQMAVQERYLSMRIDQLVEELNNYNGTNAQKLQDELTALAEAYGTLLKKLVKRVRRNLGVEAITNTGRAEIPEVLRQIIGDRVSDNTDDALRRRKFIAVSTLPEVAIKEFNEERLIERLLVLLEEAIDDNEEDEGNESHQQLDQIREVKSNIRRNLERRLANIDRSRGWGRRAGNFVDRQWSRVTFNAKRLGKWAVILAFASYLMGECYSEDDESQAPKTVIPTQPPNLPVNPSVEPTIMPGPAVDTPHIPGTPRLPSTSSEMPTSESGADAS